MFRTPRPLVDQIGRHVPSSVSSRSNRLRRRRRATLERLEDRTLLSTYEVTSALDNGASGTLRWAVQQANANPGSSIEFELGTKAKTITLLSGQLELESAVTIYDGPGEGSVTVSGNGTSRVFQIDSGVTAKLSDLTIMGGRVTGDGGGVLIDGGTVTMSDVAVTGNEAVGSAGGNGTSGHAGVAGGEAQGGGIYMNGGSLTLNNDRIVGNIAQGGPGGAGAQGAVTSFTFFHLFVLRPAEPAGEGGMGGDGQGGGLFVGAGSVSIDHTSLTQNDASGGFGGPGGTSHAGLNGQKGAHGKFLVGQGDGGAGGAGGAGGSGGQGGAGGAGQGGAVFVAGGAVTVVLGTTSQNSAVGGVGGYGGNGGAGGAGGGGGTGQAGGIVGGDGGQGGGGGQGGAGGRGGSGGAGQGGGFLIAGGTLNVLSGSISRNKALGGTGGYAGGGGRGGAGGAGGNGGGGSSKDGNGGAGGNGGVGGIAGQGGLGGVAQGGGLFSAVGSVNALDGAVVQNLAVGGAGGFGLLGGAGGTGGAGGSGSSFGDTLAFGVGGKGGDGGMGGAGGNGANGGGAQGGGLFVSSGSLVLTSSTIAENTLGTANGGAGVGGGVGGTAGPGGYQAYNPGHAPNGSSGGTGLNGNAGVGGAVAGGGLYDSSGTVGLDFVTVAENQGGVLQDGGALTATDSLFANNGYNGTGGSTGDDYNRTGTGVTRAEYSLFGTTPGGIATDATDLIGVDPLLSNPGDYGGPTETIALLPGSPAIGAGVNVSGNTADQRGMPLDSPMPDIGAFQTNPLIVNTTIDGAGSPLGDLSLRQAVNLADALGGTESISFSPSVFATPQTITLNAGQLELSSGSVAITGPAAGVTISGGGLSRVFQIDNGVAATITGLTITGGSTSGNGGGILNYGALAITDSTLTANSGGYGGAILTSGGSLNVADCTIAGNTASVSGGGIDAQNNITVTSSTFSHNVATSGGGGAIDNPNGGEYTITIEDSILSGDSCAYGPEVANAVISLGHNLVSETDNSSGWVSSDLTGTSSQPLEALLGSLGNYGGPTATIPLLPGSPAIGAGTAVGGILTDQRGMPLDSPRPDIGAFQTNPLVVNTTIDGLWSPSGDLTLRQAVKLANVLGRTESITFSPTVFAAPQTITLTVGQLELSAGSPTITGPAAGVSISGGANRVFQIDSGVTATLSGLTITGGSAAVGGGLYNSGTATLTSCTIANNSASQGGGGLANFGTVSFTNCTISGNSAGDWGGGVENYNSATLTACTISGNSVGSGGLGGGLGDFAFGATGQVASLTLTACTISGNTAGVNGGGLYNGGSGIHQPGVVATLTNCTIADNTAWRGGGLANIDTLNLADCTITGNLAAGGNGSGGLYNAQGSASLCDTIVGGNTNTAVGAASDIGGAAASSVTGSYNLIGTGGSGGLATANHNQLNVPSAQLLLGTLGNYGGPTATIPLLPGSPAIAAGIPLSGVTTDQRGVDRFARTGSGLVDIGAFESQGFTITVSSGSSQSATVNTAFATPLVVSVTSAFGEPVEDGVVTFASPQSGTSATFPGGSNTATIDASGLASIDVAANTAAGGPYFVYATTAGAFGAASFTLTNAPGTPYQLAIHTEPPPSATAGQPFSPGPVIYIEDQYGNIVTTDSTTHVIASLASGSGPLHGTTTVTAGGGVAVFSNLADDQIESIKLAFNTNTGLPTVTSGNIVVQQGPPVGLVVHTEPSATATAGQPFATQPVVYVVDQFGRLETGDNTTQVTAYLRTGTGPLLGKTTVTVSGGIAVFTNLADAKAETITLIFAGVPLDSALSSAIKVSPAAASWFGISAPASVPLKTRFTITVTAYDAYGNVATGFDGTVHFESSDPLAGLPKNYTFTSADRGVQTFENAVIFKTDRLQQIITAVDVANSSICGQCHGAGERRESGIDRGGPSAGELQESVKIPTMQTQRQVVSIGSRRAAASATAGRLPKVVLTGAMVDRVIGNGFRRFGI